MSPLKDFEVSFFISVCMKSEEIYSRQTEAWKFHISFFHVINIHKLQLEDCNFIIAIPDLIFTKPICIAAGCLVIRETNKKYGKRGIVSENQRWETGDTKIESLDLNLWKCYIFPIL